MNPEIYVWPEAGDIHILNNLIRMDADGETLHSLLESTDNEYEISSNLFYPASRIDLDPFLNENALMVNPLFLETSASIPVQSALNFQLQPGSPAIGEGTLISGSENPLDFLTNNGGRDFFGQPVSPSAQPSIGAIQSSICGSNSQWDISAGSCMPTNQSCVGDFDGDGSVAIGDLLIFLSILGIEC